MKLEDLYRAGYKVLSEGAWSITLTLNCKSIVVSKLDEDIESFQKLKEIDIDSLSFAQKVELSIALFTTRDKHLVPDYLLEFAKNTLNPKLHHEITEDSILCPVFGHKTDEVLLVSWEKPNGEYVRDGDILALSENDLGEIMEICSHKDGILTILVPPNTIVRHYD